MGAFVYHGGTVLHFRFKNVISKLTQDVETGGKELNVSGVSFQLLNRCSVTRIDEPCQLQCTMDETDEVDDSTKSAGHEHFSVSFVVATGTAASMLTLVVFLSVCCLYLRCTNRSTSEHNFLHSATSFVASGRNNPTAVRAAAVAEETRRASTVPALSR